MKLVKCRKYSTPPLHDKMEGMNIYILEILMVSNVF